MSKVIQILKYPLHIIYLIGAYIFKVIKTIFTYIYKFFAAILKGLVKGFKYIFSVIIPTIFKYIKLFFMILYKGIKYLFIYLYKGIKLFFIYLYKIIKTIFIYIYKGIKYFFIYLYKGIIGLGKGIVFVSKKIYFGFIAFFKLIYKYLKLAVIKIYEFLKLTVKYLINVIKFIIKETILIVENTIKGIIFTGKFVYKYTKIAAVKTYVFIILFIRWIVKVAREIPVIVKRTAIWVYKNVIYIIYTEFTDIFRFSIFGLYSIFMGIFYEAPRWVVRTIPILIGKAREEIKDFVTIQKQNLKEIPKKIKKHLIDSFNNTIFVKNIRNKKMLALENLTAFQIDRNSIDAIRSEKKITFKYLVKNADGKFIKGYFSAFSKLDCHSYLLDEGFEVYKIETSKWIEFTHGERKYFNVTMNKKDLIFWLTQLSTYIKSGVPLTDAAKILAEQDKRRKYKKIYDELIYELTMGESFARALEKQKNVFPALLINMVKAAEMMGEIEYTLDDMASYYTDIESTKKEMKSAMTYPLIVAGFSVAIIVFILTYVIPQFEDVYGQAGVQMNAATLMVLNISELLRGYWYVMIIAIVGTIAGVIALYKNVKAFKTVMQYLLMHMPVIGKIMIYNEMVLFSKTFSSLQKNNVLLTESIDILSKITNNEIYKVIMFDTIANLLKGDKMSDSFKDNWAIPELAYYMISTGERTGDLAAMLEKVAKYYQEQQKAMVGTLKAFIEPIMIASLALIVGGIIIAAIVPMFGMYGELV